MDDAMCDNLVGMPDEAIETLPNNGRTPGDTMAAVELHDLKLEPLRAVPEIALSTEQNAILELVRSGKSIFFTGSAGTGKSVLLRAIIRHFRDKYQLDPPHETGFEEEPNLQLAITAATGIASVNIDGCTLHSWAGIGLGTEDARDMAEKFLRHRTRVKRSEYNNHTPRSERKITAADRWKAVETLVCDEISMVDGQLFDKLEYIARHIRDNKQPFGGIQLILSGDFCQLPPVPDYINGVPQPVKFAFEANTWPDCIGQPVVLTQVFRQRDPAFVFMLNDMRLGRISAEARLQFKKLSRRVVYNDGIEPTELYPTRREVEAANSTRLSQLTGRLQRYIARDGANSNDVEVFLEPVTLKKFEAALERLIVPKEITLKVGAQVMLIKNLVQGELVNGTKGRVEEFITEQDASSRKIKCALERRRDDPAVARARDLMRIQREKYEYENYRWPLVKFESGAQVLCNRCVFEVKTAQGQIEAAREQVPLILAWALSIHKSQGQTLQRVRVDLGRTFEMGQAYVALSRATNMETLEVLNFDASKVMAHPKVLKWSDELEPAKLIVSHTSVAAGQEVQPEEASDSDDREYWAAFDG